MLVVIKRGEKKNHKLFSGPSTNQQKNKDKKHPYVILQNQPGYSKQLMVMTA